MEFQDTWVLALTTASIFAVVLMAGIWLAAKRHVAAKPTVPAQRRPLPGPERRALNREYAEGLVSEADYRARRAVLETRPTSDR